MQRALLFRILSELSACLAGVARAGTIGYRSRIVAGNPLVYLEFEESSGTTTSNSAATGLRRLM